MRCYLVGLFLFAAVIFFPLWAQTNTNEIVEAVARVEEVSLWLLKTRLWIFGGICALILSVCFFLRR